MVEGIRSIFDKIGPLWAFWALGAALLTLVTAYLIRVAHKGRPDFSRLDGQGSAFLGKALMEMGYWGMQPFARLLIFFGVTPNQISWASLLTGFLAGCAFAFGHFGSAAWLGVASAVCDSLDGMVARLTGVASETGEVLDSAMDRAVEFFFFAGLAVYYREVPALLVLTLAALLGSFMVSYSSLFARMEKVKLTMGRFAMKRPERLVYLLSGAILSPITISLWEEIPQYSMPVGHPMVFVLGLIAVFGNACAIEQFTQTIRGVRAQEADARARVADLRSPAGAEGDSAEEEVDDESSSS